jgi:hypothetical protein
MTAALAGLLAGAGLFPFSQPGGTPTMLASEIHMRDPWIMPYNGTYYLVGTTGGTWGKRGEASSATRPPT